VLAGRKRGGGEKKERNKIGILRMRTPVQVGRVGGGGRKRETTHNLIIEERRREKKKGEPKITGTKPERRRKGGLHLSIPAGTERTASFTRRGTWSEGGKEKKGNSFDLSEEKKRGKRERGAAGRSVDKRFQLMEGRRGKRNDAGQS